MYIKQWRFTITHAENKIKELHEQLKKNSPIQPGDRVRITTPAHPAVRNEVYGTIKKGDIIPEKDKGIAECVEIEIRTDVWQGADVDDIDIALPVYHPITKTGVVAKVGRFTAGNNDIIEKI